MFTCSCVSSAVGTFSSGVRQWLCIIITEIVQVRKCWALVKADDEIGKEEGEEVETMDKEASTTMLMTVSLFLKVEMKTVM